MKIDKVFTKGSSSPYDMFEYTFRSSTLRNPDGSMVFEMDDIEVPSQWSQMATDILAQKYFRKTGVPQYDKKGKQKKDKNGKPVLGPEKSIRQVVHRLAGTWRYWGEQNNYFSSVEDAQNFYDELVFMLMNQMTAPNSPQWFNTGLNWAYGISGSKQGHYFVNPDTGKLEKSKDAYTRPQPHACFIQSINDDLLNEGGIFDLATREARIFKFGSGTGTNFSSLRGEGELLSGGGKSSGLMSFLKIFDRAAGAIKSGGTTRRAAKMVIVDIDHPDIEQFIEWKAKEEEKVAALVAGSKINNTFLQAIIDEAVKGGTDRTKNEELNNLIQKSLHRGIPLSYIMRVLALVDQGFTSLNFEVFDTHYESDAYATVSGQNSNNSIRVTDSFLRAVEKDQMWELRYRTKDEVYRKVSARALWEKINLCAWKSADPGIQYDTTINEWHTCPESGRINASNPCSEYMFLDDTACNLASLNLMKFYDEKKGEFLIDEFAHGVRIWTIVLEISVLMAQFPSSQVAKLSYEFRTLGLGFANLGTLLMVNGIPYDSPEGVAMAGAVSAILTGESYATSAELAKELGPFPKYGKNKDSMLRVIRNHRRAAYFADDEEYEGLSIKPLGINPRYVSDYLVEAARKSWDKALEMGEKHGYRNAQVSVVAPTGTIGLVMDCDTTGIEPDFAIVKFKKLAGGGYFKIVNQSVEKALVKLGYSSKQIEDIEKYCKGHGTLINCPSINPNSLKAKGFTDEKLREIDKMLDSVFDIKFAFNKWTIGEEFCHKLGFTDTQINTPSFDMLAELGFTKEEIERANDYVCGTMMIEGAPHIKEGHLSVFDTANKCGKNGKRYIPHMAHVRMMAGSQPFISGAISKTVNMPAEATVAEIGNVYTEAWKLMLKAIAIYRDSSKLSQPLNVSNIEGLDEVVMLGDEDTLDETIGPKEVQEQIRENLSHRAVRRKLPKKRRGHVREAYVGGHKVYLRTGEYEDGSIGEIFIDMYKEGASYKGLLNCFAVLASKALQYGVPLEELVDSFTFTRFEPAGMVDGHEAIKTSTSILDYVFRSIGYDYLNITDFVHVKAVDEIGSSDDSKNDSNDGDDNISSESQEDEEPSGFENNGEARDINDSPEMSNENKDEQPPLLITKSNGTNTNGSHKHSNGTAIKLEQATAARQIGYTGEQCISCGSIRVKRNGSCTVCEDCGTTTGCS